MYYLIVQFWQWLLGAFILGLVAGVSFARRKPGSSLGQGWLWILLYAVVLGVGAVLASSDAVLGEQGFMLETAVLFGSVYFAGCVIGAIYRGPGPEAEADATAPAADASEAGAPAATPVAHGKPEA